MRELLKRDDFARINEYRRHVRKVNKNKDLPIDAQNLALESIKQIYNIINKQDYNNIYDNYTVSHLSNIEHQIKEILDID